MNVNGYMHKDTKKIITTIFPPTQSDDGYNLNLKDNLGPNLVWIIIVMLKYKITKVLTR